MKVANNLQMARSYTVKTGNEECVFKTKACLFRIYSPSCENAYIHHCNYGNTTEHSVWNKFDVQTVKRTST